MGACRIFLVAAALFLGCNVCVAADEHSKSQSQSMFDSLNAAYEPLKSCVDKKLETSGISRHALYSEIAASGALPQIFRVAKQLLEKPTAVESGLSNSERVRRLIEALEGRNAHAKVDHNPHTDEDYMYLAFQLRRQVAADSIIGRSPSIRCRQPSELRYWIQEEDDFELRTELGTFSMPFLECERKHLDDSVGPKLVDAIVHAGKLPELRRVANEYLGSSNLYVTLADLDVMTDAMRVRLLGGGLTIYTGSTPQENERYAVKVHRLMALVSLNRIMASSTQSKCAPSAAVAYWMDEAERRKQE